MEDKFEMEDYDGSSTYEFAPQRYGPQQPRYDNRQRYNGGQFVDPVEQLRLLLQAVPIANAPIQPALVYQAANQVAQVHNQAPPAAPPPLNLGAAAIANANAAAAAHP
jgi:hypothetical protein